jgi:nitroreductase
MSNQVFEAVRTVLAIREYQDKPIPDEGLHRIVEAGRLTASARNAQPWHFVIVREREALRKLGSLVRTGGYSASAAAAIIVACERNPYAMSDASRAIQSMILSAWADGVGSNRTGFASVEAVRKEFGIPDTYDVLAVMPLGYPTRKVIGRKRRKPFDEVVSAERFGDRWGQD